MAMVLLAGKFWRVRFVQVFGKHVHLSDFPRGVVGGCVRLTTAVVRQGAIDCEDSGGVVHGYIPFC